jgi:hypothetical protein
MTPTPEAVAQAAITCRHYAPQLRSQGLLEAAAMLEALSARLAEVEAERDALMEAVQSNLVRPDYIRAEAAEARVTALTDELAAFREAVRFATAPVPPLDLPPQPFGEQP